MVTFMRELALRGRGGEGYLGRPCQEASLFWQEKKGVNGEGWLGGNMVTKSGDEREKGCTAD